VGDARKKDGQAKELDYLRKNSMILASDCLESQHNSNEYKRRHIHEDDDFCHYRVPIHYYSFC
jgi:hypothetical protein